MPRGPRIWFPGAIYHMTARGNRKNDIFYDDLDFQKYLQLILSCQKEYSFYLHSYCLMTNHVHLLIETTNRPLGDIVRFIHTRYAMYFNKRHEMSGHLFQGRYHATLIDTPSYLSVVSRYIHLNPVRAGMVTCAEVYPWSSYRAYLTPFRKEEFLTKDKVLGLFMEPRHERYKAYVEEEEEHSEVNSPITVKR